MKKLILLFLLIASPVLAQAPPDYGGQCYGYPDDYVTVDTDNGHKCTNIPDCPGDALSYDDSTHEFSCTSLSGAGAHNVLSATHSDTLTATVLRGALIVGNSTPKWSLLSVGSADSVLHSDGTDVTWKTIPDCQDSSGNHVNYTASTNAFSCGTSSSGGSNHNVLSATHSDTTGSGSEAQGDLIYRNGSSQWTRLGIGSDDTVLNSSGTAPQWKGIPDCDDSGGSHLNYDTGTNAFSCGTSGSGSTDVISYFMNTHAWGLAYPRIDNSQATLSGPMFTGMGIFWQNCTYATTSNRRSLSCSSSSQGNGFGVTNAGRLEVNLKVYCYFRTGNSLTGMHLECGATNQSTGQVMNDLVNHTSTTSPADSAKFMHVFYDQTDANFKLCTSDGSTMGCTDTGVAAATDTDYLVTVKWDSSSSVTGVINATSTNRTSTIPAGATTVHPVIATYAAHSSGTAPIVIYKLAAEENP